MIIHYLCMHSKDFKPFCTFVPHDHVWQWCQFYIYQPMKWSPHSAHRKQRKWRLKNQLYSPFYFLFVQVCQFNIQLINTVGQLILFTFRLLTCSINSNMFLDVFFLCRFATAFITSCIGFKRLSKSYADISTVVCWWMMISSAEFTKKTPLTTVVNKFWKLHRSILDYFQLFGCFSLFSQLSQWLNIYWFVWFINISSKSLCHGSFC